jgi:hypothetical protein
VPFGNSGLARPHGAEARRGVPSICIVFDPVDLHVRMSAPEFVDSERDDVL